MIRSGIYGITGIKLMWATTSVSAALIISTRIIRKQQHGVKFWESSRETKIGNRTNDGVGR